MTTRELCESAGLTYAELVNWIAAGLLTADRANADGRNREFAPDQLERARVLKLLHDKGVRLSRLARARLDLDGAFVIFDGAGDSLRACPNAEAAIRTVVAAKRWCCGIEIPRP
jgi:hypothetical protein